MHPSLSDSVRQIRNAVDSPVPSEQFILAGSALERIERALIRDASLSSQK